MTFTIGWLIALVIGSLFGWAWGRAGADRRYAEGWDACRQRALTIAKEQDFAMIALRLEREAKTESNCR